MKNELGLPSLMLQHLLSRHVPWGPSWNGGGGEDRGLVEGDMVPRPGLCPPKAEGRHLAPAARPVGRHVDPFPPCHPGTLGTGSGDRRKEERRGQLLGLGWALKGGGDLALTSNASADTGTPAPELVESHWAPRGPLT